MSPTSTLFKLGLIIALALIAVGTMMACETIPVSTTAPVSPTIEAELAEVTPTSQTSAAETELAEVPSPTPTTAPSPTPSPVVMAPDDGCENCHTDKEQLIATAKEEEVVEELSEGEG